MAFLLPLDPRDWRSPESSVPADLAQPPLDARGACWAQQVLPRLDLRGANLCRADLRGTDLTNCLLDGTHVYRLNSIFLNLEQLALVQFLMDVF